MALDTDVAMELEQANTHVGPPLLDGLVVHPHVIVPRLGSGIPRAVAKAWALGLSQCSLLEDIMAGADLEIHHQQRTIRWSPRF